MNKENRGFSLIEIIISIAVLSIMAGVLFQTFAVSRRIDAKARKEEVVQDAARNVMEELKGYSVEKMEDLKDDGDTGDVTIGQTKFTYEPLLTTTEGYLLKGEYRLSSDAGAEPDYLIEAEVDFGRYNAAGGDTGSAYTINNYQMPNIADVSSFQNVVVSPDMLVRDDTIRESELLAKVNPVESETAEGGGETAPAAPVYDESDISKVLCVEIKENGITDSAPGKLVVKADGIYTVDVLADGSFPDEAVDFPADSSIRFAIGSFKKEIVKDEKTGKPVNRIYLFLPASDVLEFEKVYVDIDSNVSALQEEYELYVVADSSFAAVRTEESYVKMNDTVSRSISLYSNFSGKKPVSLYQAENRLCHVKVTVYEAEKADGSMVKGKELLSMESTKS